MVYSRFRLTGTRMTMYLPRLMLGNSPRLALTALVAAVATLAATMPHARAEAASETTADSASDGQAAQPAVADVQYSEDEVKAAFLFHFATYAQWPTDDNDGAITFAVLRAPEIAEKLERFAESRSIQGRPVRVRQIRSLARIDGAEVLFIGSSQNWRLGGLIEDVAGPTLVVTDVPGGLPEGAMINFMTIDQHVRFEIAPLAAQRAGVTLSSRLLSAAMRVDMSRCYLECLAPELEPEDVWELRRLPAVLKTPNSA